MTERTHPKQIGPYRILELQGDGEWVLAHLAHRPVRPYRDYPSGANIPSSFD